MKAISTRIGNLEFSHDFENGVPSQETVEKLFDEMDFQRACQAYIWGLGPVAMYEWQKEAKERFGAGNFDIVRYDSYSDKRGILTANATTPYICAFVNLNETGPLIIEAPAGATAGLVDDFWHKIVVDFGLTGKDKGQGVKLLILGPGQEVDANNDYQVYQSSTMGIFWGTRILNNEEAEAERLLNAHKVYSYADRNKPSTTRVLDVPEDVRWLGNQPRGMRYWALVTS